MTIGSETLAVLATVNGLLLGGLVTFQWKIWDELSQLKKDHADKRDGLKCEIGSKRSIEDCKEEQHRCFERFDKKISDLYREGERLCREDEKIWDSLNAHSHSGLAADSKVTRG